MVIPSFHPRRPGIPPGPARRSPRHRGALATECLFALAFIGLATIPLSFTFLQEARTSRAYYHRAALGTLLDGELELLAAAEPPAAAADAPRPPSGSPQLHPLDTQWISGLPAGQAWLTREENPRRLTLSWLPSNGRTNGILSRSRALP